MIKYFYNRSSLVLLFLLSVGFLGTACGAKKHGYTAEVAHKWSGAPDASLGAKVIWVKNKGDAIDVKLVLTNRYEQPVYVSKAGVSLSFNGQIAKTPRQIDGFITNGSSEDYTLIFRMTPEIGEKGTAILTIQNVQMASADLSILPNKKRAGKIVINLPTN